MSKNIAKKL